MLTRNILIICALAILLVEGDLDSNVGGIQAMSTDKDSTSDEAPTESMNAISPDLPNDEPQYYGGGPAEFRSTSAEIRSEISPDASAANEVTGPDTAAANSVEDEDDDDSDEGGHKNVARRASKPQPLPPQRLRPPQPQALPPKPVVPRTKAALTRSKMPSKRRSTTNRRHI